MKAILLVRVSSISQEFEEQKQNLIEDAKKLGYKRKEDRIIIENEESAIKLEIDERIGIIRMKEAIEQDNSINAVLVWELSRLARNQTEGHLLKDYFRKQKIQFYCSNPEIKLFDVENDVFVPNQNGDLTFSIFLQMTENEMRIKEARFHRSKIRNAKLGRYSGGFIKYGYYVDDNGYYQINESEAEMIRYIFNEYEKGRSIMNIMRELQKRGINSWNFVRGILISEAYTGFSNEYKMNRVYPQIISKEQFERCRDIAKKNNKRADKANEIYFAKKLIKCVECGTHYIGMKSSITYLCYGRYGKEAKIKPETACKASPTININVLDSLLWRLAKFQEQHRSDIANQNEIIKLKEQIAENSKHIKESNDALNDQTEKKERIVDNYTNGYYSKEQRDAKLKEVDKLIREIKNYIVSKRNDNERIEKIVEVKSKPELIGEELSNYLKNEISIKSKQLDEIDDDLERQEIVQRNIKEVNILEEQKNLSKIVIVT